MISQQDKYVVRELAKRYLELTSSEKQSKMRQRQIDTNDLKCVRPPLLISEIPWFQIDIDGELTCVCENERVRGVELFFRQALYYFKHFKADNNYEPFFRVQRAFDSTGIGIGPKNAQIKKTEDKNHIVSREIEDVLEDESALELMHDPVFTLRPDRDADNMEFYTSLLGDSIPSRLYGFGNLYFSPWDQITFLRGVEPILMDMYDRPEYLHAIMDKFISATKAQLDFIESSLDVDPDITDLHCTPSLVSGKARSGLKAAWFRGMAQSLGVVSPAMFKEFEIDHIKPIAERFAYTYYGCCEALDDRIDAVKEISNLRKIGCSPWAKVESCAEQIRGDFVLSRKPNPANVAILTDPEVIRKEIEETAKACIKYGCPCDIVLKDISTVSHRPENLILWSEVASGVLDEYYGAE